MKTGKELLEDKLNNFKFLIASNIKNEDNSYFIKLMEYNKIDEIIFFYNDNIKPYLSLGVDTIVSSFMSHLELNKNDNELYDKIKKYFNFFNDIITELEKNESII